MGLVRWRCRDCGGPITDDATRTLIQSRLKETVFRRNVKGDVLLLINEPNACPNCGGGRAVTETGAPMDAEFFRVHRVG